MGRVLSPSEEACHSGVPYLIFSKSNILFSISPLWKWCQSSTLSPNRRECSASFRQHCKSENYVIHGSLLCLDTFRIFPQRGKFSLGAGREPQPPQYPKHTHFSFHCSLERHKETVLLASHTLTSTMKVLIESYRQ